MQAQDDISSQAPVQDGLTEYEVTIHTADTPGAGTDADVSLRMIGTAGDDGLSLTSAGQLRMMMHYAMVVKQGCICVPYRVDQRQASM